MYQKFKNIFDILNVSRETFLMLDAYVNLILKWNAKMNLTASYDAEQIWIKHILVSAELILFIMDKDIKLIDLGSGAGMPGIVLSIMGVKEVILIESNAKKAAFLLQAAQISKFKIKIINDRIQNHQLNCDIITSRALASVDKLLDFSKYVNFTDRILLIKGSSVKSEISFSKKFIFDILDSRFNQNTSIVSIKKSNESHNINY